MNATASSLPLSSARLLPSDPVSEVSLRPCHADTIAQLLALLEASYAGRTGVLVFGPAARPSGLVIIEEGRVCWAAAPRTRRRLAALLREKIRDPERAARLDELCDERRKSGTPLCDALMDEELLSPDDLRGALLQHSLDSLREMQSALAAPPEFHPRRGGRFDARFTFSASELLARTGAMAEGALDEGELALLDLAAGPEGIAFAFRLPQATAPRGAGAPCLVAALRGEALSIDHLTRIGVWILGQTRGSSAGAPLPSIVAHWDDAGRAIVAYHRGATISVAVCASQDAAARAIGAFHRARAAT